jgi:hypothetical protein
VKQYTLHILKGTGLRASNVRFFSFVCKKNCASIKYLLSHDHLGISKSCFCFVLFCRKVLVLRNVQVFFKEYCHNENPYTYKVTFLQLVVICIVCPKSPRSSHTINLLALVMDLHASKTLRTGLYKSLAHRFFA